MHSSTKDQARKSILLKSRSDRFTGIAAERCRTRENASSGFALRTYRDPNAGSNLGMGLWTERSGCPETHLPSEGPMRRPSDSERKRGVGRITYYWTSFADLNDKSESDNLSLKSVFQNNPWINNFNPIDGSLIEWKVNLGDRNNPNGSSISFVVGYSCSYKRCNNRVIIPDLVFELVRTLKGRYNEFESKLPILFPLLQESVELSIRNNKPVPADIQAIFIPILRDSIYKQCTWYHSYKLESLGVNYYFSKDKVIWELEPK
jgi:hypothetical protein